MLEDASIRDRGIVKKAKDEHFRPAGYDLTVGKIISKDGTEVAADFLVLEPHGGMAEAISAESVEMPKDVLAYATPKTTVSRDGILAMNVGIVDPGYRGLISTTLINLSKREFILHKETPFLRLSFHQVRTPPEKVKTEWQTDEEYVRKEKNKARLHFSESFLDIPAVVKSVAPELVEKYRNAAFVWFPAMLLLVSGLTFIFNYVAPRWMAPPEVRNACQMVVEDRVRAIEQKFAAMQSEVGAAGSSANAAAAPLAAAPGTATKPAETTAGKPNPANPPPAK